MAKYIRIFSILMMMLPYYSHAENSTASSIEFDEVNRFYVSLTSIKYGDVRNDRVIVKFGIIEGYDENSKIELGEVFLEIQPKSMNALKWKFEAGWIVVENEEAKASYKVRVPLHDGRNGKHDDGTGK
jgi:hypothetical protein